MNSQASNANDSHGDLHHQNHENEMKVPLLNDHVHDDVERTSLELNAKVIKDGICLQPQSSPSKEDVYWNS